MPLEPAVMLDEIEPGAERRKARWVRQVDRDEEEGGGKGGPAPIVDRPARMPRDTFAGKRSIGLVGQRASTGRHDCEWRRQQPVDVKVVEGRQKLAMREIPAPPKMTSVMPFGGAAVMRIPTSRSRRDRERGGEPCG